MFSKRLISGIILIILSLVFILAGGPLLLAGLALVSAIGIFELNRVVKVHNKLPGIAAVIAGLLYYIWIYKFPATDVIPSGIVITWLTVDLAIYVFTFPKFHTQQIFMSFVSVIYVAFTLSCIYRLRTEYGCLLVWPLFLASWGSDTLAYCAGRLFGKHKMAPILSPKKTIEGAVGGVAGAAALGAIYGLIFQKDISAWLSPAGCALVCAIGALISMVGDLAASAIKRDYDVKDYGNLIPGHGGVMDRFDSVIFVAPVIYLLVEFMVR